MLQSCYWWWHDLEHIGTNGRLYIVDVMPSLKSHKSRLILFIPTIASPFHCCQPSISDLLHLPDLRRSTYALRASARGLRHIPRPAPVRRPPGLAVDDAAETARFAPRHLYPDERDEPVVVVRTVPRLVFVGWTDKIDLSTPFYPPFPRSTPKDNVMWNCQSLIDQGVIDYIQSISRLKAINYTKSLPSSRTRTFTIHALNGAKLCVYISAADKRASGYPVYCLVGVGISHGLIDSAYLRYPFPFLKPTFPSSYSSEASFGAFSFASLACLGPLESWSPTFSSRLSGVVVGRNNLQLVATLRHIQSQEILWFELPPGELSATAWETTPVEPRTIAWACLTAHGSSAPCGATSLGNPSRGCPMEEA
ncbi:hypothetical protein BC938DRAFT_478701 [Jimgerdemannia flammicorona]|uniref:Uncharacterized protein n=1 Tax=Jimgerdemannia flammicorona TaxID=994334 RepID=A0A433QMH4_9FUNG|nr:hypothetical protein BC938DRAFT_478701 [Jimgerdemannia flammicorona]